MLKNFACMWHFNNNPIFSQGQTLQSFQPKPETLPHGEHISAAIFLALISDFSSLSSDSIAK